MSDPDIQEFCCQYDISDAAEAAAMIDAERIDDIQILRQYLEEAAAREEENICMIYLQKMIKAAKFSSDYIDIAGILQKYTGLQDYFSLAECVEKAKQSAKVPGDWLEIQQFTESLNIGNEVFNEKIS